MRQRKFFHVYSNIYSGKLGLFLDSLVILKKEIHKSYMHLEKSLMFDK